MSGDSSQGAASTGKSTAGPSTAKLREPYTFAAVATKVLEAIGLLNKGSSGSAATPTVDEAQKTAGISSNTLNVTRVGGFAALIAVVGAAALAIFQVNKSTDKASIVVAAYASVGAIIASALLTAAIIISSDIRARAATSPAASPSAPPADPNTTKTTPPGANDCSGAGTNSAGPESVKADTTETPPADANAFGDAWYRALSVLHYAVYRVEHTPDAGWADAATRVWLEAVGSSGKTASLHPVDDGQTSLQARLSAGQSNVISLLNNLQEGRDPKNTAATIAKIQPLLDAMDQSLPWP